MMQESFFHSQESGPYEDHSVSKLHKVLEEDDPVHWRSGIFRVERECADIETFVDNIPFLVRQNGTYGLIWSKNLQPSDGRYEQGEHYCCTREPQRRSVSGSVSIYRDGETGTKFAIKTLQDANHFHSLEVKVGLGCDSPNLCAVYGVIVRDHKIHILLEHAGSELVKERSWIANSTSNILSFAKQSFHALKDLHSCGYVHCDIKPDNIMIVCDEQKDNFTVKIVDFGSCQPIGGTLPPNAHTTRYYWSPEVWQTLCNGDNVICQPSMDVYALALTLFFVQTSSHLMNKLEERDVLSLMTQRPDDLLLIALPETIPCGLRAVMRPCLTGNVDERWSAQQAASQLDGDAMMQKALSYPQNGTYKDLFNQLLQDQFKKTVQPQSSVPRSPTLPVTSLFDLKQDECTGANDALTDRGYHPQIHYFVGANQNKGTAEPSKPHVSCKKSENKADVGLNIKNKRPAPERKQFMNTSSSSSKVKKNDGLRSKIAPKPRRMTNGDNSSRCKTLISKTKDQSEHEIYYISSDETMSISFSKTGNLHTSLPNKGEKLCLLDKNPNLAADTPKTNTGKKNTLVKFAPTQPHNMKSSEAVSTQDSTYFYFSTLLANLASQAGPSHNSLPYFHQLSATLEDSERQEQVVERDKSEKAFCAENNSSIIKGQNLSCEWSQQLKGRISENLQNLSLSTKPEDVSCAINNTAQPMEDAFFSSAHATSNTAESIKSVLVPSAKSATHMDHLSNQHSTQVRKEKQDDMEFMLQTLEVPQHCSGHAEDILDNLCNLLDKEEQTKKINFPCTEGLLPKLDISQNFRQEKFQDANIEINIVTKPPYSRVQLSQNRSKPSLKRMLPMEKCSIPTKVIAQSQITDELLPNFEQILPDQS